MYADKQLTQKQVAELLNIQPRTLESWRQRRIGPPFVAYSRRCIRYRERDLQRWLETQTIVTEPTNRTAR
jgi:hypothetical protein